MKINLQQNRTCSKIPKFVLEIHIVKMEFRSSGTQGTENPWDIQATKQGKGRNSVAAEHLLVMQTVQFKASLLEGDVKD